MKYIRHESSIFNLPASVVGAAAYLLVGVGMLVPLVAQFSLLVALALFLLERRSQMARAHCLQATLLQALYNLIRAHLGVLFEFFREQAEWKKETGPFDDSRENGISVAAE